MSYNLEEQIANLIEAYKNGPDGETSLSWAQAQSDF